MIDKVCGQHKLGLGTVNSSKNTARDVRGGKQKSWQPSGDQKKAAERNIQLGLPWEKKAIAQNMVSTLAHLYHIS